LEHKVRQYFMAVMLVVELHMVVLETLLEVVVELDQLELELMEIITQVVLVELGMYLL
jgi:hypothetical protein